MTRSNWLNIAGRVAAGVGLGCAWTAIVDFCWIGLLVAAYGSLDRGLDQMTGKQWVPTAFGGWFTSSIAAFVGGSIGVLVRPLNARGSAIIYSAAGASISAFVGVLIGMLSGWICWQAVPKSDLMIWLPIGLSVPVGLLGAWVGSHALR